jgi:hypothetical protein
MSIFQWTARWIISPMGHKEVEKAHVRRLPSVRGKAGIVLKPSAHGSIGKGKFIMGQQMMSTKIIRRR